MFTQITRKSIQRIVVIALFLTTLTVFVEKSGAEKKPIRIASEIFYNAGSVVILKRDFSGVVSEAVRDDAKLSVSGVFYNAGSVVILKMTPLGTAPGVIKTVGKK